MMRKATFAGAAQAEILQVEDCGVASTFEKRVEVGLKVFTVLRELLIFHCPKVQLLSKAERAVEKLLSVE